MNIQSEGQNAKVQEIKIEIFKDDYAEKVENALKKQRKTAQVPGFRPGNVPMGMIKNMYEKHFISEEVNKMVGEALYGYIQDHNLKTLGEPILIDDKTTVDFENSSDFVFTFEIGLEPQFEIDFDTLPAVNAFKIKASDKEREEFISQLRKRHGEFVNPEVVAENDYITIEYAPEKEGYFFESELNEKGKKLFIGKKVGDEFKVALKNIFSQKSGLAKFLKIKESDIEADNTYEYEIKIKNIGRVNPAELNEEFFKKAYPNGEVTNEKELDKMATAEIEKQWKLETDKQFMNNAIETLIDSVNIDLPDDYLKRYMVISQKDLTMEHVTEKYSDYQKSFKWQLIENKLVQDNNIVVTEEEVKDYIRDFFMKNYFVNFNQEDVADRVNSLVDDAFKNKKDVKNIYDQLYDMKIQELLYSKLKLNEKKGDFNDFIADTMGKQEEATGKKATKSKAKKTETPEAEDPKTKVKKTKKTE